MPVLTLQDKRTLRTLVIKVIYFTFIIGALMFIHLLIGISNLEIAQKEILLAIDFWGAVAYLSYFLITGLWNLVRIEFPRGRRQLNT